MVHTQARVLTDQEVLYKYVRKNVLFVVTVSPRAAGPIGSTTPEEAWLVAYLIDTVTGRILHRVTHQGMQGPVHAVSTIQCLILIRLGKISLILIYLKD